MRVVDVLGVPVAAVDLEEAVATVDSWISSGSRSYACLVNVHVVETARTSPELRRALAASGLNLPDGAPVAWLAGRAATGRRASRVTGSDLFDALCRGGPRRHFFVGSTPATLGRLCDAVRARYPEAEISGAHSPPFRPLTDAESAELASAINAADPEIVWVGLGAPRQETWMLANRHRLSAPALIGVGAVFDFASGTKNRAPGWVQRAGLEWAHRLLSEPRRLLRRYLVTNATFLARAAGMLAQERLAASPTVTEAAERAKRALDERLGRGLHVGVRVRCELTRLGSPYGRYAVCQGILSPDSVVYSFGVGEDVSFDLALADRTGAVVHCFDPTPKAVSFMTKVEKTTSRLRFHRYGIADFDGEVEFSPPADPAHASFRISPFDRHADRFPVRRLSTIMEELGHDRVDLLKLDIEGAELSVIDDLLAAGIDVGQIAVEFHHRMPEIGVEQTRRRIAALVEAGYEPVHVSPRGNEVSFVAARRLTGAGAALRQEGVVR